MSRVLDAIGWNGYSFVVIIFLAVPSHPSLDLSRFLYHRNVKSIKPFVLEVEPGEFPISRVYEYDLEFDSIPEGFDDLLAAVLDDACSQEDAVAWLSFEGCFNFGSILTPDMEGEIYGVCAHGEEAVVALSDNSPQWSKISEKMKSYRNRII
ncbi:hypothetical protein ACOALZ_00520 [Nocardiopsis algeriensis]|uniref:hypothetical protein n=1 Tax=Nocardiopsis algeriensis TaxID=1478215 RepID=UPI003B4345D2